MVNLRCCEIHEIKNDKIIESHILIDVMDLIFQTGVFPVNPSRGSEGNSSPRRSKSFNADSSSRPRRDRRK